MPTFVHGTMTMPNRNEPLIGGGSKQGRFVPATDPALTSTNSNFLPLPRNVCSPHQRPIIDDTFVNNTSDNNPVTAIKAHLDTSEETDGFSKEACSRYGSTRSQADQDEVCIPWQEEMRRVEAARYRRYMSELRRSRQQERIDRSNKEWVWVVDEDMELYEMEVKVGVSLRSRIRDAFRKFFSPRTSYFNRNKLSLNS